VATSGRRAAVDRGARERAPATRCLLPRLCHRDPGRTSPRGAAVGVRAAAASRGRDARRAQPCLAPRHDRARTRAVRRRAGDRLKRWPALWTFTHTDGVEPTNNHAERGLRGAVIYRKLSHGSQSERGERTIERLLSASITCRLQKRSLFAYLTDVLHANIRGDPILALS
jgi:Transposase IS66 family